MAEEKYRFTKDFFTDIPFIDDEHRHLFELTNATYDLLIDQFTADKYDKISDLIDELGEYAQTHFAHEEKYMKSIHFQHYWSELRAHKLFVQKVTSFDLASLDEGEDQDKAIAELIDFLAKWLTHHIKFADHRIGDATKKLKAEGNKEAAASDTIKAAAPARKSRKAAPAKK